MINIFQSDCTVHNVQYTLNDGLNGAINIMIHSHIINLDMYTYSPRIPRY